MLSVAARAVAGVVRWLVLAVSGAAGTAIGAVVGLLSGLIDEEGLAESTVTGAIAGALVSLEIADSLGAIWNLDGCSMYSRISSTLLLLRNLPRSLLFPTMVNIIPQDSPHLELMMEPRRAAVERLPATMVTKETVAAGLQTTCPICLDEFAAGEIARTLPACCHVFHLACIDIWLLWNSQCPMCRHAAY